MPVAEIAAAITSFRMSLDIAKAMVGLRDEETFRAKAIELQTVITDALEKSIDAREAYAAQLDRVHALEAEMAQMKGWDAEKQRYELKSIGTGAVAYVLKPKARAAEAPHWLCPTCFEHGKKSFFQSARKMQDRHLILERAVCEAMIAVSHDLSRWPD
jgi:hypothetical protein